MKTQLLLTSFAILLSSISFAATPAKPYTLGGILGDPTGFSAKYQLTEDTAVDGAIAWGFGGRSGTQIHGDYLQFHEGQISAGDAELDLYYGAGARIVSISGGGDNGKIAIGPRFPIGLLHRTENPNLEYFGEAALILDVVPSTSLDLDLAVGIRLRF